MNRIALALLVALVPLLAASSASACGMYRPAKQELLMAKSAIKKGDAALKRNELRTAIRQYNRAMTAKGNRNTRAIAAIKAGEVYTQLGKKKQAIRRFERAVRIAPRFIRARTILAFAVLKTDTAKAITHFEHVLESDPKSPGDTHAGLAIAYGRQGNLAKAKVHLQNARLNGASVELIIDAEKIVDQGPTPALAARS